MEAPLTLDVKQLEVINELGRDAGVLPYSFHEGKAVFLLGGEPRRRQKSIVFFDFGGKGRKRDYSIDTAAREFSEGLFDNFLLIFKDYLINNLNFNRNVWCIWRYEWR